MKTAFLVVLVLVTLCMPVFAGTLPPGYAEEKAAMHPNNPNRAIVTSLCNAVVCVQVNDLGDFNIGTPDGRSLLYFYPGDPWSTDLRIWVDGLIYNLTTYNGVACDGNATFVSWTNNGTDIVCTFTLGNLVIEVIHTPVMFSATLGAALTRTIVHNMDSTMHEIGVLYEYDTTVDGDDAAQLYFGPNYVTVETCFDAPYNDPYWDALPSTNTFVGRGTFTGGQAVTPDHLAFGSWGNFYATCWTPTCSGNPYGDSSVLYRWDPRPVPPQGSRDVATYYGPAPIQMVPGELQLSVVESQLQCTPLGVIPNPFQIIINVINTGGLPCTDVFVQMSDGAGPGGTATITSANPVLLGTINPGLNGSSTFTAQLNSVVTGGCIFFTATVTSTDCPMNQVNFCVNVPPCEPCQFHSEVSDMGDLPACNYPTLCSNPSHELTDIAWLGEWINGEPCPNYINVDPFDDGVFFIGSSWVPCTAEAVLVMVSAGANYGAYRECGGHLYLSAWKDGNIDGDFCDILCNGMVPEWIIQDVPVEPGIHTFHIMDPGYRDVPPYPGIFRFRLMSAPHGPFGFGMMTSECPEMQCGAFDYDYLGEVEDYVIDRLQPVELTSFTVTPGDNQVTLNWSTESETNNSRFEIERNDVMVYAVDGAGTTSQPQNYNWTDTRVLNGTTYTYTLVGVDGSGRREELRTLESTPTWQSATVTVYGLHQNYPNPFNPTTQIIYDMKESGFVTVSVYNLIGQKVATLVSGEQSSGSHIAVFSGADLPSGVYICKMVTAGFEAQTKMLLVK